jgi:RimJ/RimL family protein N-acetyltransferase
MVESIKTVDLTKLSAPQTKLFQAVLKEAAQNQFLGGDEETSVAKRPKCVVILHGDKEEPIGFYTPKKQNLLGKDHWRAGIIFISSRFQGQGIMKKVLGDFFATHQPGLSWIEDANAASIRLFTSLGFTQFKRRDSDDGRPGHWYIQKKGALAVESLPAPIYSRW